MPGAPPLIGITTYPPNAADRYELPEPYVAAVRRAGGEPVLVPPGVAEPAALLDRLDGLVLAGGGDVDPATYGGTGHETVYQLDPARDATEIAVVHRILATGLPTLAICRGSQVLAVALGGSLVAHLPDHLAGVPGAERHRIEPDVPRGPATPTPHPVEVEAGSLVARAMGATSVTPMSWHHQAVDRVPDGLRVVGRAPDGTVEATEHDTHPFLLAVQWHPELTAAQDPTQQALFDALVARCAAPGAGDRRTPTAQEATP